MPLLHIHTVFTLRVSALALPWYIAVNTRSQIARMTLGVIHLRKRLACYSLLWVYMRLVGCHILSQPQSSLKTLNLYASPLRACYAQRNSIGFRVGRACYAQAINSTQQWVFVALFGVLNNLLTG